MLSWYGTSSVLFFTKLLPDAFPLGDLMGDSDGEGSVSFFQEDPVVLNQIFAPWNPCHSESSLIPISILVLDTGSLLILLL